jgi:hypothetical protein
MVARAIEISVDINFRRRFPHYFIYIGFGVSPPQKDEGRNKKSYKSNK